MEFKVNVAGSDPGIFTCALHFLKKRVDPASRAMHDAADPRVLDPEDLVVATLGRRVVGVVFARPVPGCTAFVSAPILDSHLPDAIQTDLSARLVRCAAEQLDRRGVRLIHALVEPTAQGSPSFESAGFTSVTDVLQMRRACNVVRTPPTVDSVEFVPILAPTDATLVKVVESTYRGSLDIPELNGLRDTAVVLGGYAAAGVFQPELWQLVRRGDEFIGCLLMSHWPDEKHCEIRYMGLVPHARGKGIGRSICRQAIDLACRLDADEISLMVDVRNVPARKLYESAGFATVERRTLLLFESGSATGVTTP